MTLLKTIEQDFLASMRKREHERIAVLRLLKTGLKNFAIAKRLPESQLSDEQVQGVLRQEVKKRKESIDAFQKGGRAQLADKEQKELVMLESYLPPTLSVEDIRRLIGEVVSEETLTAPYQFGRLMGLVVKKVAGRADGVIIKAEVEKYIAGT